MGVLLGAGKLPHSGPESTRVRSDRCCRGASTGGGVGHLDGGGVRVLGACTKRWVVCVVAEARLGWVGPNGPCPGCCRLGSVPDDAIRGWWRSRGVHGVRRLLVLLLAAGVVLAGLTVVQAPVAEAAPRKATKVRGFVLPDQVKPGQVASDRFRVTGPKRRPIVLQHRAPGQRWQTVQRARTTSKRQAQVRVQVVRSGGRWVWKARVQNKRWVTVARTSGTVHEFRVKVPRKARFKPVVSNTERVRVVTPKPPAPSAASASAGGCDSAAGACWVVGDAGGRAGRVVLGRESSRRIWRATGCTGPATQMAAGPVTPRDRARTSRWWCRVCRTVSLCGSG